MKKGKIYYYEKIEDYATNEGFEMTEYGNYVIGENIIVLTKESGYGIVMTFVLVAETQFECVYSDL